MRYVFYAITMGLVVAVTFGLFSVWGWQGLVPNLLLLIIVSTALAFNNLDYLMFAFIGGIWFDTLYGLPLGSFAVPFIFIGLACSLAFQRWLFAEVAWWHFILATFLGTIALNAWLWIYTNGLHAFDWSPIAIHSGQLLRTTLFMLVANVLLAYPVYVIVELIAQSTMRFNKNKIKL